MRSAFSVLRSKRFSVVAFALTVAIAAWLLPTSARGQVTGVSNLTQTSSSSIDVGQETGGETFAQGFSFTTGATSMTLLNVDLKFENASIGGLTGFAFSLYSGFTATGPTTHLVTFTGSNGPATAGTHSYSPASPTTLSANTTYYLVATAPTLSISREHFHISTTSTTDEDAGGIAGWRIDNTRWESGNAGIAPWTQLSGDVPQFSLTVSAVPEPSTYALLLGIAGLGTAWLRRRSRAG